MIVDKIQNAARYFSLSPSLEKIFAVVSDRRRGDPDTFCEIESSVTVSFFQTNTKKEKDAVFENHAEAVDVHVLIEGRERIDIADAADRQLTEDHYAESDCALLERPPESRSVCLSPGDFVILFPGEAHCPALSDDGRVQTIRKAVGKFRFRKEEKEQ